MKKALTLCAFTAFFAANAFATYVVVLKDGTRYAAKAKWTVVNGKAIVSLENGQSLQLDPSLIDTAKSEQATKLGLGNAKVLDLDPNMPAGTAPKQQPSLGSTIKLRQRPKAATETAPPAPVAPPPTGMLPSVIDKFERAYDNVGIFEKKITSNGPHAIRAELTVDTEERVFNAISATSFLMIRNAGVEGVQIDVVELYMKTTTGGAAGRFQMNRADAEALDKRTISQQDYFVRNVLY